MESRVARFWRSRLARGHIVERLHLGHVVAQQDGAAVHDRGVFRRNAGHASAAGVKQAYTGDGQTRAAANAQSVRDRRSLWTSGRHHLRRPAFVSPPGKFIHFPFVHEATRRTRRRPCLRRIETSAKGRTDFVEPSRMTRLMSRRLPFPRNHLPSLRLGAPIAASLARHVMAIPASAVSLEQEASSRNAAGSSPIARSWPGGSWSAARSLRRQCGSVLGDRELVGQKPASRPDPTPCRPPIGFHGGRSVQSRWRVQSVQKVLVRQIRRAHRSAAATIGAVAAGAIGQEDIVPTSQRLVRQAWIIEDSIGVGLQELGAFPSFDDRDPAAPISRRTTATRRKMERRRVDRPDTGLVRDRPASLVSNVNRRTRLGY